MQFVNYGTLWRFGRTKKVGHSPYGIAPIWPEYDQPVLVPLAYIISMYFQLYAYKS
jgi:hypothetical protein